MQPLINTIMDQPYEMGPIMVLADWLMERGDPRGDRLVKLPKIIETIKTLKQTPDADYFLRAEAEAKLKTKQKLLLFLGLLARYTPVNDQQTVGDFQIHVATQRYVTATILESFDLLPAILHRHAAVKAAETFSHCDSNFAWAASAAVDAFWVLGDRAKAYRWQTNLAKWIKKNGNEK